MKIVSKIIVSACLFCSINLFAQIDAENSTVQTIAYWDLGEKQEYTITNEKVKITGNDTISKEFSTYDVDITVIDSTANSYIMEWYYKNNKNQVNHKVGKIIDELRIRFKTDEMGAFQEILNLNEVQDYVKKTFDELKKSIDNAPKETEPFFDNMKNMFTSKEVIESLILRDIQVFHTFHGGQYALGEVVESQIEIDNVFGGKPFLADITLILDDINLEEYNYVLKYYQSVDAEQLKTAVKDVSELLGADVFPEEKKVDFDMLGIDNLENESYVGSVIHDSGWVLYTIYTRGITLKNYTTLETLIIEIK